MATDPLKDRILAEIAAHLRVYGRARWELIRERPEFSSIIGKPAGKVGERKFFRWVEAVARGPLKQDGGGGVFEGTAAAAAAMDDGRRRALLAAQRNIPAAPSPSYLVRKGPDAEQGINFLAMLGQVIADINKLRSLAIRADDSQPDGEKVINPHIFGQSIDKRLKAMDTALRTMQEIWDLQYQQRFYDEIVAIIVEEMAAYPEAQERAIRRLAELNKRRGMTMYADPA